MTTKRNVQTTTLRFLPVPTGSLKAIEVCVQDTMSALVDAIDTEPNTSRVLACAVQKLEPLPVYRARVER